MAKAYSGAVSFANAFSYSSAVPMDDRTVVETKADLTVADNWKKNGVFFAYDGMSVVTKDTGEVYTLCAGAEGVSDATIARPECWVNPNDWEEY